VNEAQRRDEFLTLVRNRMDPALRGADYDRHFNAVRAERPDLLDNRAAPTLAIANSFDPNQPRDELGRWAEVGLEGSDKQVAWAKEIRAKKHPGMKAVMDELDSPELTEDYWDDSDRMAAKAMIEKAATRTHAADWIDERDAWSVRRGTHRDPFSFKTREEAELQEKREKAIDWAMDRARAKKDRDLNIRMAKEKSIPKDEYERLRFQA
jgi:hypothetical protein